MLTVVLIVFLWQGWALQCMDCVPHADPDSYGGMRLDIRWPLTPLVSGLMAFLVVLFGLVVSRALRRKPGS